MSAQLRTNSALRVDVTVYKNRACIYECLRVMFAVPWQSKHLLNAFRLSFVFIHHIRFLGGAGRVRARRAREDLGWEPVEPEWEEFAERDVEHALTFLGVKYKHED